MSEVVLQTVTVVPPDVPPFLPGVQLSAQIDAVTVCSFISLQTCRKEKVFKGIKFNFYRFLFIPW